MAQLYLLRPPANDLAEDTVSFGVVGLASTIVGSLKVLQLYLISFCCGVLDFQTLQGLHLDLFATQLLVFWLAASMLKACLISPAVGASHCVSFWAVAAVEEHFSFLTFLDLFFFFKPWP